MSKNIQLAIHEPCHENWDAMTPQEKGRFCGSCQKEVIDFTGMNDQQLAQFFKKPSTGSVCGRFMSDQLNHNLAVPQKRIPWLSYFFTLALPPLLASCESNAQAKEKIMMGDTMIVDSPTIKGKIMAQPVANISVTGFVTDEEDNALANIQVTFRETGATVYTDSLGKFSYQYPGTARKLNIIVSGMGYLATKKMISVRKNAAPERIELEQEVPDVITVGMISVKRD